MLCSRCLFSTPLSTPNTLYPTTTPPQAIFLFLLAADLHSKPLVLHPHWVEGKMG